MLMHAKRVLTKNLVLTKKVQMLSQLIRIQLPPKKRIIVMKVVMPMVVLTRVKI